MSRSVEHLTLKEVEEAKRHNLTPEKYEELRQLFESRQQNKVRDRVKDQIVNEVTAELRVKVRAEIEQEVRQKTEAAFLSEERAKIEAKVRAEMATEVPHEKDIRAYKDYAREIEFDCLVLANAASEMADRKSVDRHRNRRWRTPINWILVAMLPVVYFFTNAHFSGFMWLLSLVTYLVVGSLSVGLAFHVDDELEKEEKALRQTSSEYYQLADRAKKMRAVELAAARTRGELRDVVARIVNDKANSDRGFHPAAKMIDQSRARVRDQIAVEMDTERLIGEEEVESDVIEALRKQA